MSTRIAIARGSLTDGDELVLVNASNTGVDLGSGVSAAIRRAGGPEYQARIHGALKARFGGPMPPGEVLVTDAGDAPRARWVAHVAVMDYRPGAAEPLPDAARIRAACARLWPAIEAIETGDALTVAMVALGAGVGGLGVRVPTEIACDTLREHLSTNSRIARVTFYGYALPEHLAITEVVTSRFPDATQGS